MKGNDEIELLFTVCLIVFTSTDNYAVLLFIYRPRKKSRQHNVRRSFVALLVWPDKKNLLRNLFSCYGILQ